MDTKVIRHPSTGITTWARKGGDSNRNTNGPLGPDYLGYPEFDPTPNTLGPLGPDYFNGYQGDWAPEHRDCDMGEEGGDSNRNTKINFSLGYQTKVGLYVVAQPPKHNVAYFGVAHLIPGGTRMTSYRPSNAIPSPSTLADHNPPPPLK